MITIENVETCGWEAAIRGMRNPLNSWSKSDSVFQFLADEDGSEARFEFDLGRRDLELASKLANAGTDHGKFLRFIVVYCDVTAPLYWWKEMDTYRAGVEKNSCSTMHKIHDKPFVFDDFSTDQLQITAAENLTHTIGTLNEYRKRYLKDKDKDDWWQLIQLLPTSYNQRRTMMMSYAALKNMYHSRKFHKLDEWRAFCKWIESLPYSELITGSAHITEEDDLK